MTADLNAAQAADLGAEAPSRRTRLLVAIGIGCAAGLIGYVSMSQPGYQGDLVFWWTAARALLDGQNPYDVIPGILPHRMATPFLYPLPAALVTIPFAKLPYAFAGACFTAFSAALLAYAVTRDGFYRLPLFLSGPFVAAVLSGQWSPLLTACALLPWLAPILPVKPTLGLAAFAYYPRWTTALAATVVCLASLAVVPSWPWDWWYDTAGVTHHPIPVLTLFGAPLLLALLRWRRPEARLLVTLACMPQVAGFYDQLPLWLVPRSRREAVALTLISQGACLAWLLLRMVYWPDGARYLFAALYLPCLVMILRRPNEGPMPALLAQLLTLWPRSAARAQ